MNWPNSFHRMSSTSHLERLGEQLGDLAIRVREAVCGLAGDAVGGVVRDLLARFWQQLPSAVAARRSSPERPASSDWSASDEWDRDETEWGTQPARAPSREPPVAAPSSSWLALALQAAGWWLQQNGSSLGALGLALAFGGAVLLGGQVVATPVLDGVVDLSALLMLMSLGVKHLALN